MKICLFGALGQLGKEFEGISEACVPHEIVPFDLDQVDIRDLDGVQAVLRRENPQGIINAAAYTAVDKAESESELSYEVNAIGAKNIAIAARDVGSRLISVSTDYVFGGEAQRACSSPFKEGDSPDPCNVYGASKLAGEQEVLKEYGATSLVVRTSSVHGSHGPNFVHTMLRLLEERDEVRIVDDQVMSPTWAGWLAEVLLLMTEGSQTGILHACCEGSVSWYEFAVAIRDTATFPEGVTPAEVQPIPTSEFPTPAKRPVYSVLDCSLLEEVCSGVRIHWREGLRRHLQDLGRCSEKEIGA